MSSVVALNFTRNVRVVENVIFAISVLVLSSDSVTFFKMPPHNVFQGYLF